MFCGPREGKGGILLFGKPQGSSVLLEVYKPPSPINYNNNIIYNNTMGLQCIVKIVCDTTFPRRCLVPMHYYQISNMTKTADHDRNVTAYELMF